MYLMQSVDDGAVRRRDETPRVALVVQVLDVNVTQRQRRHADLVDHGVRQHLERFADLDRPRGRLLPLVLVLRQPVVVNT